MDGWRMDGLRAEWMRSIWPSVKCQLDCRIVANLQPIQVFHSGFCVEALEENSDFSSNLQDKLGMETLGSWLAELTHSEVSLEVKA